MSSAAVVVRNNQFLKGPVMKIMRWLSILVLSAILMSCASHPPINAAAGSERPVITSEHGTYRIGVDDVLQVDVWKNPDLSVREPVRPDGKITVPLVGDVQAGGRTPMDVASEIRKDLAAYIRDPNVTVIVVKLRSNEFLSRVRVTGAVNKPITMPYRPGMTVLDAVLEAGGTNSFAAPDGTRLYRHVGQKVETFHIDLGDILKRGDLQSNMLLQPGDVITVPERLF